MESDAASIWSPRDRTPVTRGLARWTSTPRQRRLALVTVKGVHTLVFLVLGGGVLEIVRAGIRGRPSRATGPAITAVIGEGVVLLISGNRCPLTGLAEELGDADGRISDIFLPAWFARHIPSICTALVGFSLGRFIETQSRDADRGGAS